MKIITANRASAILFWFLKKFSDGAYLLPANICPIVPLTFLKAKVKFQFVDIEPKNYCIDRNMVLDMLKTNPRKYKGIVFVHTYGREYEVEEFFSDLKKLNEDFKIIDDRCLCFPNVNQIIGFADLVLFSTTYGKVVDMGKGGFAVVEDNEIFESKYLLYNPEDLQKLNNNCKYCYQNSKKISVENNNWLDADLNTLGEEYFIEISKKIEESKKIKNSLNTIYDDKLPNSIKLGKDFNSWRFNILVDNQQEILDSILQNKLFASSHYDVTSKIFNDNKYPVAENLSKAIINLFNDRYFSEDKAIRICEIINSHIQK